MTEQKTIDRPEETKQNRRMTLGPELSAYLATLPDPSGAGLDIAFKELLDTQQRAAFLGDCCIKRAIWRRSYF